MAANIDSQSVKTTEAGGRRGYDAARVGDAASIDVEIVRRIDGQVGLTVRPRRRDVGRTLARLGRR